MADEEAFVLALRRSASDSHALIPTPTKRCPSHSSSGANTPSGAVTPRTRGSRAFSLNKLADTFKKGRSRRVSSRRSSIDKASISSPIIDPRSPLRPTEPEGALDCLSPTPSYSPQNVSLRYLPPVRPVPPPRSLSKHGYSVSDPTSSTSTPERPRVHTRQPPSVPTISSFSTVGSSIGSPLESIYESYEDDREAPEQLDLAEVNKQLEKMEPIRQSLLPPAAVTGTKAKAIEQARDMQALVVERAKRSGDEPPQYDFQELIGKGAYGRVFKGKSRKHSGLVAIKIIDIDTVDYQEMTTKNLSETLKEIDILQQLRDSKARPYVNIIEEARAVHNELWIISEYASGGSVNTLMKPTLSIKDPGPGLPEKFVIPIARELALGLKYIHEAGVLHRDLKCNNVLILEDGRVQLCDFGVSGTLEPAKSKRTTIVGTPNWMAPELQREWIKDADPHSRVKPQEILYGSEVDIWAYGCTVYEMACGRAPHQGTGIRDLPTAGVPTLEGGRFSDELHDFLATVLQPLAQDRPTPDDILEHPYLVDTTKMYPTVILVKLVEDYYVWERQVANARQSLFFDGGAQAPDPLGPEPEDEDDDDWTFSTSEEFEQEHAPRFSNPFTSGTAAQPYAGMNLPPVEDIGRFEQLQARFKEESITRGQTRLNHVFDTETTPYRYSMVEGSEESGGRPPSDLVLRDFNPGAPNRETVIDLDFSVPSTEEIPSIDLGEVPTIRQNRMKSLIREMEEEDARDALEHVQDDLTKRATRDWTFPSAEEPESEVTDNRKTMEWSFPAGGADPPNRKTMEWSFPATAEPPNRKTMEWSFPTEQPKPNRKTVEWTFDAAMAEANYEGPKNRISRRRETKEWTFPSSTAPDPNRSTRDFAFPMRNSGLGAEQNGFEGQYSNVTSRLNAQAGPSDDFPTVTSSPTSPMRGSMIDLDMATVEDYRPSTSGSASTYTASSYTANDNPFSLEDQVQLSQNNHRASFHMKSQSEPNHAVPGLLTPQQYDAQGLPINQDHPGLHARGLSSISQMQAQGRTPPNGMPPGGYRSGQRSQPSWDGWSHANAYGLGSDDQSPAMSVTTDTSQEEEDIDELWDTFERLTVISQRRYQSYAPLRSSRRTDSRDDPHDARSSDTDDNHPYASDSSSPPYPHLRQSRVSAGPNGKPLVDFPIPRGPDPEALLGIEMDPRAVQDMLLRSAVELRDGTRSSRDLLRAMRLEEVDDDDGEVGQQTVRLSRA